MRARASTPGFAPPRQTPRARRVVGAGLLVVVSGCAEPVAPDTPVDDAPFVFDPDACDPTCGDGPFYLIDALTFPSATNDNLPGFDLDGLDGDCGVADGLDPDGATGIDNRLSVTFPSLPEGISSILPDALQLSVNTGAAMYILEVVGAPDLDADGPVALVMHRGDGTVRLGAHGRPLAWQTVDLMPDTPPAGVAVEARLEAGVVQTGAFPLTLSFGYLNANIVLPMERGQARLVDDGVGGVDLLIGGVAPLAQVMDLIGLLGGDDAGTRALLEQVVPLLVDARTDPDGPCDGITGVVQGHAVPAFLWDEDLGAE